MLYSISYYYDIQAALGLAGLVVFETIMITQEVDLNGLDYHHHSKYSQSNFLFYPFEQ
jgi:hypothetical protein